VKEYTLLAVISVVATVILDRKTGVGVLARLEFYIFLIIILLFKLLVNGYLTGEGIVLYNPRFFLGLRLGTIPVEDFLFGFSMVTMTLILWEYFRGIDRGQ
jgi:lycopene cyclase domain-containing protein